MKVTRTDRAPLPLLERFLVGMEIILAVGAYGGALGLVTGGVDLGETAADLWR